LGENISVSKKKRYNFYSEGGGETVTLELILMTAVSVAQAIGAILLIYLAIKEVKKLEKEE